MAHSLGSRPVDSEVLYPSCVQRVISLQREDEILAMMGSLWLLQKDSVSKPFGVPASSASRPPRAYNSHAVDRLPTELSKLRLYLMAYGSRPNAETPFSWELIWTVYCK